MLWKKERDSKAQLQQDLFVLWALNNRKNGYYVEFGATDGVSLSNTWYLEKAFGWTGILAEPGQEWHEELIKNRGEKNHLEFGCVWSTTGETLDFHEVGHYSTLQSFSDKDVHAKERAKSKTIYPVQTISLLDMLIKYDAPKHIDYLSIDTEGSELEILKAFDFSEYRIDIITCEHNFTNIREDIYQLLTKNDYERVWVKDSKWDDWYILRRPAP